MELPIHYLSIVSKGWQRGKIPNLTLPKKEKKHVKETVGFLMSLPRTARISPEMLQDCTWLSKTAA